MCYFGGVCRGPRIVRQIPGANPSRSSKVTIFRPKTCYFWRAPRCPSGGAVGGEGAAPLRPRTSHLLLFLEPLSCSSRATRSRSLAPSSAAMASNAWGGTAIQRVLEIVVPAGRRLFLAAEFRGRCLHRGLVGVLLPLVAVLWQASALKRRFEGDPTSRSDKKGRQAPLVLAP